MKGEVRRRLEEIERMLFWTGAVTRKHLIGAFGISPQQGSADLSLYKDSNPGAMDYDGSATKYIPAKEFTPVFFTPSLKDYLDWSASSISSTHQPQMPARQLSAEVLGVITQAIHQCRSINIVYQSMSNPEPVSRRVAPHSLVFTHRRAHLRGYCYQREDFRDFVVGRVQSVDAPLAHEGPDLSDDEKWRTLIPLRIAPHPDLSPHQAKMIAAEYGMENGISILRVREPLLLYYLEELRFDDFMDQRPPHAQQIVLLNRGDVMEYVP